MVWVYSTWATSMIRRSRNANLAPRLDSYFFVATILSNGYFWQFYVRSTVRIAAAAAAASSSSYCSVLNLSAVSSVQFIVHRERTSLNCVYENSYHKYYEYATYCLVCTAQAQDTRNQNLYRFVYPGSSVHLLYISTSLPLLLYDCYEYLEHTHMYDPCDFQTVSSDVVHTTSPHHSQRSSAGARS